MNKNYNVIYYVTDAWIEGSTREAVLKQMKEETDDVRKSRYQKVYHARKRAAVSDSVTEGDQ